MSKVEREDLWHSVRNEIMLRRNFFLQLFQMKYFHLLGIRLLEEFVSEAYSESWKSNRPEVFCKKGVLRNFSKFTGKHLCLSLFFNKLAGLRLKKRLWHTCFPVNFEKFLRTSFFTEHLLWLLLQINNFYFHWNHQKTLGFLMMSGGIEVINWLKFA